MALAIIAAAYIAYGLVSARLRSTVVTAPMVFVGVGLIVGPVGLGLVSTTADVALADGIFELTLILVLFSDAFAIDAPRLLRERALPLRLLAVGLPLTIGLGWAVAAVVFGGLDIWEAALVGAVLAPTDASLAQPVISDRRVPRVVRDGLNVESGLNDGIALPFVIIFIGLTGEAAAGAEPGILDTFLRALVLSALLGGLVGWLGGRLVTMAGRLGWIAGRGGRWCSWRPPCLPTPARPSSTAAASSRPGWPGWLRAWRRAVPSGPVLPRRGRIHLHRRPGSPAHHGQLPGLRRPAARPAAGARSRCPSSSSPSWP